MVTIALGHLTRNNHFGNNVQYFELDVFISCVLHLHSSLDSHNMPSTLPCYFHVLYSKWMCWLFDGFVCAI